MFRTQVKVEGSQNLTIATTCKPFKGLTAIHQSNALGSWRKIFPEAEIIIYGSEDGTRETARTIHATHIPRKGIPRLDEMLSYLQKEAKYEAICYLNGDIIATQSLKDATDRILDLHRQMKWPNFLVIAQRWDVPLDGQIRFDEPDWEEKLTDYVREKGRIHPTIGMDLFFFLRGLWHTIPPFLMARWEWDTWLVWYALHRLNTQIVDATKVTLLVHPKHKAETMPEEEVAHNRRLCQEHRAHCGQAHWRLTDTGLERN